MNNNDVDGPSRNVHYETDTCFSSSARGVYRRLRRIIYACDLHTTLMVDHVQFNIGC